MEGLEMFEVVAYITRRYGLGPDTVESREELLDDLLDAGFHGEDVERALRWIRRLRSGAEASLARMERTPELARVHTVAESQKLTRGAWGLLVRLERGGILPPALREAVYEQALALDVPQLGVKEVSVLVAALLKIGCRAAEGVADKILAGQLGWIHQ